MSFGSGNVSSTSFRFSIGNGENQFKELAAVVFGPYAKSIRLSAGLNERYSFYTESIDLGDSFAGRLDDFVEKLGVLVDDCFRCELQADEEEYSGEFFGGPSIEAVEAFKDEWVVDAAIEGLTEKQKSLLYVKLARTVQEASSDSFDRLRGG